MSYGNNAREACRTISSVADEITAQTKGIANVFANLPVVALLNPNNYAAKNELKNNLRNVTNVDISDNDIINISNKCSNLASQIQSNVIDTSSCSTPAMITAWGTYFPDKPFPTLSNITQSNKAIAHQQCVMNNLLDLVKEKGSKVDAAAFAVAKMKAENMASNSTSNDICNVMNQDLSSNQYIEMVNSCSNNLSTEQSNLIQGCLPMFNVVQSNDNKSMQSCISSANGGIQNSSNADTSVAGKSESDQTALGMNPFLIGGIVSVICFVIILSLAFSYYKMS